MAAPSTILYGIHIDASMRLFATDKYDAALVARRACPRGTAARVISLRDALTAAADPGPALVQAGTAVVSIRLKVSALRKRNPAFRYPLATRSARGTVSVCVAPGPRN